MMKKQFVILGTGRFGSSIAMKLMDLGAEVMVVDKDEDIIQSMADKVTYAVQADVTDENSIQALGIRNFDTAVVTIGDDIQSSILVTLMVKELGLKRIIAKAQTELHAKVLYKIGADRVVFPEREMGIRVAKNLMSSNFMDFIELAPDYSIVEIAPLNDWLGQTLLSLDIRGKFGLNVMAIRKGTDINISVMANDVIEAGDIMVVIGHNDDLRKLEGN
ncbi:MULTISPECIES: TrkA family potassium uptake protein [unclassified Fusibacter]|uniref:potassium channel family protein n=1 Tax=unclassified Fusibacter TaxID=2624464 RepID=UPI001012FBC8|nr:MULTISPECIES: TrkA family potassium uptake protein [unclassified Fusibacter]MCK8058707.1 TrkA family potassium uptake protein [Fusibacter sp. A2]NPE21781.1 TrkA family potassium uptake protein [Fusibacter sp. A1]RXV61354.1 TrkA family potassium uptake protein [Fusibacter sp. A1]